MAKAPSYSSPFDPPVARVLARMGIPYRVFRHPGPVRSLAQAAAERGQRPDQVVRSILFRLSDGEYVLVLVNGPRRIDWRALRRHLGRSRLTLASPEEVLAVTGYPIGAVGPLGLAQPLRILVDADVPTQEEISLGSGVPGVAVILRTVDLLRALGAVEFGHFAQAPQEN